MVFELAVSILLLVISGALAYTAVNVPMGLAPMFWVSPGAFPLILSVILVILSIWWILDTIVRMRDNKRLHPDAPKKHWYDEVFGERAHKISLIIISAAVIIYIFVLIPVLGDVSKDYGFTIASFIFLCVTIKVFNEISIPKTILISAASVVIIYVVFHFGLKVIMPA